MAKKKTIIVDAQGKNIKGVAKDVKQTRQETEKLDKSRKKLNKTTDNYNRREKGAAQLGMNSTKSFSKMQQSIGDEGGGGAGGLVRAYALLAANVFALSAAFGILSRSAQVDTLIESMTRLEVVTGNAVKSMARELQAAASGGLDFAEAMRSTSLALSAGFDSSTIKELGEVAKNAAVSLGRPIADSLDRIFRGVIKVEPELLDEIGLFVRVKEAAARYASSLGMAASELTEFQKRQAFAVESVRQGKEKFEEFADIDIDAFALLAASFSDLTHWVLSFVNKGLGPIIKLLAENKELLGAAFGAIAIALLRKAIPAMGLFTRSIADQARTATAAHANYVNEIKSKKQLEKEALLEKIALEKQAQAEAIRGAQTARREADKGRTFKGGKKLAAADLAIKESVSGESRILALKQKQAALNHSIRDGTRQAIIEEQAALEREIQMEQELLGLKQQQQTVEDQAIATGGKNKLAQLTTAKLARKEILAVGMASVSATAETHGFWAALRQIKVELKLMGVAATEAGVKIGWFSKTLFAAKGAAVALQTAITALLTRMMGFLGIVILFIPVIVFFLKKLGFWSAEAKALSEVTERMNELAGDFGMKMKHNTKVLLDAESPTKKLQQAQLALSRSTRDTSSVIIEQTIALKNFLREVDKWPKIWHDVITKMGFGPEASLNTAQNNFFGGMIDSFSTLGVSMRAELQQTSRENSRAFLELELAQENYNKALDETLAAEKLLKEHDRKKPAEDSRTFGQIWDSTIEENKESEKEMVKWKGERLAIQQKIFDLEEHSTSLGVKYGKDKQTLIDRLKLERTLMRDIANLSKKTAAGAEVMISVREGAQDALRDYVDQFIVKTDVDKPLATFAQLTSNILKDNDKLKVSQEERAFTLREISEGESAIFDLMSRELQLEYEKASLIDKDKKDRLGRAALSKKRDDAQIAILRKAKKEYEEQQRVLIQNKNTIQTMAKLQKMMTKLTKEHSHFFKANLAMDKEKLRLEIESAKWAHKRFLSTNKTTVKEFEGLVAMKDREAAMKQWLDLGNTRAEFLSAEVNLQKIQLMQFQQEINNKTESFKVEKATAEIALKRLRVQENLNKAQAKYVELQRQMSSFRMRGSTSLGHPESIAAIGAAEDLRRKTAKENYNLQVRIIKAQFAILKTEAQLLAKRAELSGVEGFAISTVITDLDAAMNVQIDVLTQGLANAALGFVVDLAKGLEGLDLLAGLEKGAGPTRLNNFIMDIMGAGVTLRETSAKSATAKERKEQLYRDMDKEPASPEGKQRIEDMLKEVEQLNIEIDALDAVNFAAKVDIMTQSFLQFADAVKELGPEGAVAGALANFSANLLQMGTIAHEVISKEGIKSLEGFAAAAQMVSTVIAGFASVLAADARAKTAALDEQIKMEKKLDGKSEQSLAKIKAMEAKKEAHKRKAFETNKKLMIAQAIISTAAAAAIALTLGPIFGPILAAAITALGMAQVALIRKTSYQGGEISNVESNTQLNIGSRNNKVDVSRGASGGELSYLRGERGMGQGSGFTSTGGAAGLRKGYNTGGQILVGEQGPEVIQARGGYEVIPNDRLGGGNANVNFTINAVDAAGVEDVLLRQRGNIIGMIRSAANDAGEGFLETVDTDVVGVG